MYVYIYILFEMSPLISWLTLFQSQSSSAAKKKIYTMKGIIYMCGVMFGRWSKSLFGQVNDVDSYYM
jgi:hypothetical protein